LCASTYLTKFFENWYLFRWPRRDGLYGTRRLATILECCIIVLSHEAVHSTWLSSVIFFNVLLTEHHTVKPTWSTFHPVYWESRGLYMFRALLAHPQEALHNGIWYTAWGELQPCHSQLTLYARNISNAVCAVPPRVEWIMLETYRDPLILNKLDEKWIMLGSLYSIILFSSLLHTYFSLFPNQSQAIHLVSCIYTISRDQILLNVITPRFSGKMHSYTPPLCPDVSVHTVTVKLSLNFITGCWGYATDREDKIN
jgi:hypothetical protein